MCVYHMMDKWGVVEREERPISFDSLSRFASHGHSIVCPISCLCACPHVFFIQFMHLLSSLFTFCTFIIILLNVIFHNSSPIINQNKSFVSKFISITCFFIILIHDENISVILKILIRKQMDLQNI